MTRLVIFDLDDTLWQWGTTWHAGYTAFNDHLTIEHGVPLDHLKSAWVEHFRVTAGIEFPPTPPYLSAFTYLPAAKLVDIYFEALEVSRQARDSSLVVFDGARDTLAALSDQGVTLVAHTDAPMSAAIHRIQSANLDMMFDAIYAAPVFRDFAPTAAQLYTTELRHPHWEKKPSTMVINHILNHYSLSPSDVAYVGDSPRRDMAMALATGVAPLWASYGTTYAGRDEVLPDLYAIHKIDRPISYEDAHDTDPSRLIRLDSVSDVLRHVG